MLSNLLDLLQLRTHTESENILVCFQDNRAAGHTFVLIWQRRYGEGWPRCVHTLSTLRHNTQKVKQGGLARNS